MQKKYYTFLVLLGLVSFLSFFILPYFSPQLTSRFDNFSSQLFYYLYPKDKLGKDIVIVQIDDYSLEKINKKWPFPRSFYARALDILNQEGARVIGFDLVFQGQSPLEEDDLAFKAALRSLRNKVILASYLKKGGVFVSLGEFQEEAIVGLIDAIQEGEGTVKKMWGFIEEDGSYKFSWAVEIVSRYYGVIPQKEDKGIRINKQVLPLDESKYLQVNYLLKPKDFQTISFYNLLNCEFEPGFFANKIVLIGPTAEIIHDILPTPLGRMPGVFIQANEIVTILEGKYLSALPLFLTGGICLVILFLIGLIIISFGFLRSAFLSLGVILGLLWFSMGLKYLGWQLPYGAITVSAFNFFALGNIFNYFKFLALLLKIKNEMAIDPFTGLFKLRYFYERANLDAASFPRKRRYLLIIVLEEFGVVTKGRDFRDLKKIWEELTFLLFGISKLWSRYGYEVIIGVTPENIEAKKLQESLRTVFFEHNIKVTPKVGSLLLDISLNIRDALPDLIEQLRSQPQTSVTFNEKDLPHYPQRKYKEYDFISSLYVDSETKNRELLYAIEKRLEEEKKAQQTYLQFISSLVTALESKDPYTEGHSEKVCRYALLLADAIEVSGQEREKIRKAALLHDLGKIGIPDRILHKKGKLTPEEFSFVKEHEILSIKILEPLKEFQDILPYILHHHENFDGSGYPHGLAGEFIPLGARIIAIADVFDALTTGRDYRQAFSPKKAIAELIQMKGKRLDPSLVDIFLKVLRKNYSHFFKNKLGTNY